MILGGEWEPEEILNHSNTGWQPSGKSEQKGLVTALIVDNLDDDPEMEIIVGYWGEKSQLIASAEKLLVLYYGDFDESGAVDPILSCYLHGESYPFVARDDITGQLPYWRNIHKLP